MTYKLDQAWLESVGLGALPVDTRNALLHQTYETLERRVGMQLAENMSDAQLDQFEAFINANDERGALEWLQTNFPDYQGAVARVLEQLTDEVRAAAPQIIAAEHA